MQNIIILWCCVLLCCVVLLVLKEVAVLAPPLTFSNTPRRDALNTFIFVVILGESNEYRQVR